MEGALDALDEVLVASDALGRLVVCNDAARVVCGALVPGDDVVASMHDRIYRLDGRTLMPREETPLHRALHGERVDGMELVVLAPDGSRHVLACNARPLLDDRGALVGAVVAAQDVTKHREAAVVARDALTGLATRQTAIERLATVGGARPEGSRGLILVDLDGFQSVNEDLGRIHGDDLLVAVARRLRDEVGGLGTVARLGGDTFGVVSDDLGGPTGALELADRLLRAVREPFEVGGRTMALTASAGATVADTEQSEPQTLLHEAELALHLAKSAGGDMPVLFSVEMRAERRRQRQLERGLRRALDESEFLVHYQPVVDLGTRRIVGFEALVRWHDPERGLVPPGEFIPAAERTNLIVPLGAWVLESAVEQLRSWQAVERPGSAMTVAVNVSARQLDPAFVQVLEGVLGRTGIDPATVTLEITESIVTEGEAAMKTLADVKALGVGLAMDDFGTGYSSLSYLRRLDVDAVKIDRSFVSGLGTEPGDTAIVAATIAMGHALGMTVVAEGVETADQVERLRAMGCDFAQGFYFARPMTVEGIDALLAQPDDYGNARIDTQLPAVMVVDDAADVRQFAAMSLGASGYEVHQAADGEEALRRAFELRPAAIVLDVDMPGRSGLEVCQELRDDPRTADCAILILTGDDRAEEKVRAFSAGADDYVLKPFSPRQLVGHVTAALDRRARARATARPSRD